MFRRFLICAVLASLTLAGCSPEQTRVNSASAYTTKAAPPHRPRSEWAMAWSDVPVDPGFRFGRLANGMRYAIRRNSTPAATGVVRFEIEAGSLDESDDELGYAHFVEHMAFNGSTHVAEGEMVRLLERNGLAFGADTNAFTNYEETLYKLDLPKNEPQLLETALMLMRETASELTLSPAAVEREKGVILSEMRDREGWRMKDYVKQTDFFYPQSRFSRRLAIGTEASIKAVTAERLRAFWQREYLPAKATLVVVGDFDPDAVEAMIRSRFGDWQRNDAVDGPQPAPGPIDVTDKARTTINIDPSLSERLVMTRFAPWQDEPDTIANRRENLLQDIGYAIINRRLVSLTRSPSPPFRAASFGTANIFRAAKSSSLAIDSVDGRWKGAMIAAVTEYRRALAYGFSKEEVAEQIANRLRGARNASAAQDTRANRELADSVITLVRDELVPARPSDGLARIEAFVPRITPAMVLAALKRDAVRLEEPVMRFSGRREPQGGTEALRAAWDEAMAVRLTRPTKVTQPSFAYTDFGPAGAVVSDSREPALGIRQVRFANGVRLNLKHTDIEKNRVVVQFSLDGGDMLNTRSRPLITEMVSVLSGGGLGRHSQDQLQSILAGRTVGIGLNSTPETFVTLVSTTPDDLDLQMQLITATITDPGYRLEAQTLYYNSINTYFTRLRATPRDALSNSIGAILSDNDPRFTLQPVEAFRSLSFAKLKADLADRFSNGAIEIGMVGDLDEDAAIASVARTLGALPPREPEFRAYGDRRDRPFTKDRSRRIVRHLGQPDQALVRFTWPTRDGEDALAALQLELLERVAQNRLTEVIREELGKAYSPSASSDASRIWRGFGTFTFLAPVSVSEVPTVRTAMLRVAAELGSKPASDDELRRAREPMMEALENQLKSNRGWIEVVDRAQTEPDRIDRMLKAKGRLAAITAEDLRQAAATWLKPDQAVEIDVFPERRDAQAN